MNDQQKSIHSIIPSFNGKCRVCAVAISKGEQAWFDPNGARGERLICANCHGKDAVAVVPQAADMIGGDGTPDAPVDIASLKEAMGQLGCRALYKIHQDVIGPFGFNYAKDERTRLKQNLIDYMTDAALVSNKLAELDAAVRGGAAGNNGGKGEGGGEGQQGKAEGEGEPKGEGEGEDEGEGKSEQQNAEDALLRKIVERGGGVNEERVKEMIDEALAEMPEPEGVAPKPQVIKVESPKMPEGIQIDSPHPLFEKVLRLAMAGLNVMIKGPAGCGKTHLAEQVAKSLNRDFAFISGSAGASESQLTGRLLPTGENGRFEYHESPFVKMYENGGLFLFDEMDAFDPNMLLIVNTAMANGGFMVEARREKPYVKRHGEHISLAAVNTFGTGADSTYVGRFQLDAASLDRWYVIEMDYNTEYEASLYGGVAKNPTNKWRADKEPTDADILALGEWVMSVREKAQASKLKRVVSTRMVQKAIAARRALIPTKEIKRDLLAGWTKDELSKVGVAA